ncbi:MAG TPA: hypothetical protein VE619_00060 [Nitrososphaeraceae archaeon]|nr:hypothetical protein [Nitrososphaeraceae archaeon]
MNLTKEQEERQNEKNYNNTKDYLSAYSNPFTLGTTFWQSLMTNWLNVYGELFKNGVKMSEYWYDTYWKSWLNWPQRESEHKSKIKVE